MATDYVTRSRNTRIQAVPIRDSLNRKNPIDNFFVVVGSRSSFTASLKGIKRKANVDLQLLNSNNQVIATAKKPGNLAETLKVSSLEAGTYVLRAVLKGKKPTSYRLSASTTLTPAGSSLTPSSIDSAGGTTTTARSLSVGATPVTAIDSVNPDSDDKDFYSFTITGAPTARLTLNLTRTAPGGAADVAILDSLGNNVDSEYVGTSDGGWTVTKPLKAGTYYLSVDSFLSQFNYTFSLSATPIPDLAGDTPGTARSIALSSTPSTYTDFVGVGDLQDFYQFTVGDTGAPSAKFSATLTGVGGNVLGGSATVRLRDSLNNVIKTEYPSGGGGALFDETLAAGTYYVQVETSSSAVDYNLNLSAVPIADATGNTPPTARNISVTTTPTTYSEFVGPGDDDDYFRFTVPAGSTQLNVALTGAGGNLLTDTVTVRLRDA